MRAKGGFLLVLALIAAAVAGCASDGKKHRWYPNGGPPRNEDWHSPVKTLMKYDANHDGVLTRAELESGLKAEFDSYDKNHSGCLDLDEVRAINEERTRSDESAASPLIDWKNKGCIDFDEYATTARSLFEQVDHNGDGRLTKDEINPKTMRDRPSGVEPGEVSHGSGGY